MSTKVSVFASDFTVEAEDLRPLDPESPHLRSHLIRSRARLLRLESTVSTGSGGTNNENDPARMERNRRSRQSSALRWATVFRRSDPRFQIMQFFNGLAEATMLEATAGDKLSGPPPAVFTVWRPTSREAVRKMMMGEGTGKGLDVKGKSAKSGRLSSYVPFVQIHEESHKREVRRLRHDGRLRMYYRTESARDEAARHLKQISEEMENAVKDMSSIGCRPGLLVGCHWDWYVSNPSIDILDGDLSPKRRSLDSLGSITPSRCHGIELPERVFWEAYVVRRSIEREAGSDYDTGRESEPSYQDMNFASTRILNRDDDEDESTKEEGSSCDSEDGSKRQTVIWQHADPSLGEDPMDPRTLLVAYEEYGRVLPVVSDFDCFLVGTRGVPYTDPLPPDQVDAMSTTIDRIERILDGPNTSHPWSVRWLDLLKVEAYKRSDQQVSCNVDDMPVFGYGDPTSYAVIEGAVKHFRSNGAVRHGAESFNYCFPQDLDDKYLVVLGDRDPGCVPWMYVTEKQLRKVLCEKIDEGFTFPINPKWILCDPGWKDVCDRLLSSQRPHVQESLCCWYPPESGIRDRLQEVHANHPGGFVTQLFDGLVGSLVSDRLLAPPPLRRMSTEAMDLAMFNLNHFIILQRAKRKVRALVNWRALAQWSKENSGRRMIAKEDVEKTILRLEELGLMQPAEEVVKPKRKIRKPKMKVPQWVLQMSTDSTDSTSLL